MISKDNLIGMLEKCLANEDDFVAAYGEKFLDKLKAEETLSPEAKQDLEELANTLVSDTRRHSEIISALIQKIREDARDEF